MLHRIRRGHTGIFAALSIGAGCAGAGSTGGPTPRGGQYDVVITNGRIVDGTGAAWFHGDLAVQGDRIARITPAGLLNDAPARVRIVARGHVVAPGFTHGALEVLFPVVDYLRGLNATTYDFTHDGSRFLFIQRSTEDDIIVVVNWLEEVRRLFEDGQ